MMWTLHLQTPNNKYQTSRWQLLFHFIISEFSGIHKCLLKLFSAVGNNCFSFGVFSRWSLCKMTLLKTESADSESLSLKDSKIFWKELKFVNSIARIRWWKSRHIKQTTILKLHNLLNEQIQNYTACIKTIKSHYRHVLYSLDKILWSLRPLNYIF